MRVFITGASGWIGSATVDELLAKGHEVVGLARSDGSAASLAAKGAQVRRGDLDDLGSIRDGAADADAVIHLANKHDFTDPQVSNRAERAAVETIGNVLKGTDRPFLFASGVAGLAPGRPSTELDPSPFHGPDSPRGGAENLALEYVQMGVRSVSLRFAPTVHGAGDHGFIAALVNIARQQGVSGYPGGGSNQWSAVHRSDAARLIGLALTAAPAGAILHAVGETGVTTSDIADAIGRGLHLPVTSVAPADTQAHFGWIGAFFGMDLAASSELTQQQMGWLPTGPTLVEDLDSGSYFRTKAE